MSETKETAGKTARRGARCAAHRKATPKKWRTARRDGRTVDVSPDGRTIYGTAQEVRDAALMPWRRHWLAEALKIRHMTCRDRDELRETAAAARRDAVRMGATDAAADMASVAIPAELLIRVTAAARFMERPTDVFVREACESFIEATLDMVHGETGKRELPLTRHELDALERIGAERPENGHRGARA